MPADVLLELILPGGILSHTGRDDNPPRPRHDPRTVESDGERRPYDRVRYRDDVRLRVRKEPLIKRLHRIEGQVRGVERMVDEERYCVDILTQISAVTTALESLAFKILDDHVTHCVSGALASGNPEVAEHKSQELLAAVHRFSRAR